MYCAQVFGMFARTCVHFLNDCRSEYYLPTDKSFLFLKCRIMNPSIINIIPGEAIHKVTRVILIMPPQRSSANITIQLEIKDAAPTATNSGQK